MPVSSVQGTDHLMTAPKLATAGDPAHPHHYAGRGPGAQQFRGTPHRVSCQTAPGTSVSTSCSDTVSWGVWTLHVPRVTPSWSLGHPHNDQWLSYLAGRHPQVAAWSTTALRLASCEALRPSEAQLTRHAPPNPNTCMPFPRGCRSLIEVCRGLAAMISDQREQLAAHAPQPTSDGSAGKEQPQRRRRRHGRRRRHDAAFPTHSTQSDSAHTNTELKVNGSPSSRFQAGDPSTKTCGAATHGSGPTEATAVYIYSIPCTTAAAKAVATAENQQGDRDSVESAGRKAYACGGGDGVIPAPEPWLLLTQQLVDAVCAVSTLRRLELGFAEGQAHELYRWGPAILLRAWEDAPPPTGEQQPLGHASRVRHSSAHC